MCAGNVPRVEEARFISVNHRLPLWIPRQRSECVYNASHDIAEELMQQGRHFSKCLFLLQRRGGKSRDVHTRSGVVGRRSGRVNVGSGTEEGNAQCPRESRGLNPSVMSHVHNHIALGQVHEKEGDGRSVDAAVIGDGGARVPRGQSGTGTGTGGKATSRTID